MRASHAVLAGDETQTKPVGSSLLLVDFSCACKNARPRGILLLSCWRRARYVESGLFI